MTLGLYRYRWRYWKKKRKKHFET